MSAEVQPFRRVLLKLSGESLSTGGAGAGLCPSEIAHIVQQLKRVQQLGVQLAIVVGGGNIIRGGRFISGTSIIQESTAHYMGMLGTAINALALVDALEHFGCPARFMSAIRMDSIGEPFSIRKCNRHLERGRIVVFGCGTGNPFVTTDTAAALRACELRADILLKATRVDGVFNADPEKNPHAVMYERLTYHQVLERKLNVMDLTAIGMCLDNKVPILVFNYTKEGNIERAIAGDRIGTYVGV